MARSWRAAFAVYRDARLLAIFGMGFASGLPLLLTTSTLAYWLAREGVDKTSIGLFALVGLPYALKFAWAPLLDRAALPGLRRLGRRRSWILAIQALLVVTVLGLGASDPVLRPLATAALAFVLAFLSATQDIAIDAYRIEILDDHEQGAGAAATQTGYRVGLLSAGAGAIALADFVAWPEVFSVLALLLAASMLFVVFAPEPVGVSVASAAPERKSLAKDFVDPLRAIGEWPRFGLILAFALTYKLGEAIAGAMANPFFVELGYSGVEVASVTKVLGLGATLLGIAAGGVLVARVGLLPGLALGGVAQAVTNLLYAWLATLGHEPGALAVAVVSDNFTGGVASAVFVAYFSSWCRGPFSATQYALLTSLMATGRTLFAGTSGWLAAEMGWSSFFVFSALLAVPGLVLLRSIPDPARERRARAASDLDV